MLFILLIPILFVLSWFWLPQPWARLLLWLQCKTAGVESQYCHVDEHRFHYLRGGQGPTLVLIHGFGADAYNWILLAARLKKHFSLLIPDLVGFGQSSRDQAAAYDVAAQADRVIKLLDQLNIEHFHLAGNSMGGWISTQLAERCPQRVRSLWLLDPLGVQSSRLSPTLQAIDAGRDSALQISTVAEYQQRVIGSLFVKTPWIPYPLIHAMARQGIANLSLLSRILSQVRTESTAMEELIQGLQMPVLLQWGSHDRVTDISGADILARLNPALELYIQPNTGHVPMLERPAQCARRYAEFLADKCPEDAPGLNTF